MYNKDCVYEYDRKSVILGGKQDPGIWCLIKYSDDPCNCVEDSEKIHLDNSKQPKCHEFTDHYRAYSWLRIEDESVGTAFLSCHSGMCSTTKTSTAASQLLTGVCCHHRKAAQRLGATRTTPSATTTRSASSADCIEPCAVYCIYNTLCMMRMAANVCDTRATAYSTVPGVRNSTT